MPLTANTQEPLLLTGDVGAQDYSFRQLRQLTQGVSAGVVGPTDLLVTAGAGLTVSVAAGYAWVPGTGITGPEGQHKYGVPLTGATVLGNVPAPTTATRRDSVVLRVFDTGDDAANSSGLNGARVEYRVNPVQSLTPEAVPANAILLSYCDVPVGAAAITAAMLTDMRAVSGPRATQRGGAGQAIVTVVDAKQRVVHAPEGARSSDLLLLPSGPWHGKPYISNGGSVTAAAGLNATIARMQGMLNGRPFDTLAAATIPLTANTTNRIWYQAQENAAGEVTGFAFVVRTDLVVPTGGQAVIVGEAVTGAAAVSTVASSFRGVIEPGALIAKAIRTASDSTAGGVSLVSIPVFGDGHTPMRVSGYLAAITANTAFDRFSVKLRRGGATAIQNCYTHAPGNSTSIGPFRLVSEQLAATVGASSFDMAGFRDIGAGGATYVAAADAPCHIAAHWDF